MTEYAIIGGGIIGMLTAFYLLEEGKSVSIYDKAGVGSESSWAGGGILSPLYPWRYSIGVNQLSNWSKRNYRPVLEKLHAVSGIDPEYIRSGLICHNLTEGELKTAITWCDDNDTFHRKVTEDELHNLEPNLTKCEGHTLLLPEIAQVRNPRLMKALRQYLITSGVKLYENTQIDDIEAGQGCYTLMSDGAAVLSVDKIIIAAGAWSSSLLERINVQLTVEPIKGQMLLYKARSSDLKHIVLFDDHYVIPRADGHILAGSTLERVGFDKTTTKEARSELSSFAESLLPVLGKREIIKQWSGLRPARSDATPIVSAVENMEGIFVNTGHFRNGVVTGLASARLMVDIVTDKKSELNAEYYSVQHKTKIK